MTKIGIVVIVDTAVLGRHHPPPPTHHHRTPPTRQHRLDHRTVIVIGDIVVRITMMIGSQCDKIITVIMIVLIMIALLVRRNTITVDGRGEWIRQIQVGITTLIHRAMIVVNQQEAAGAAALEG